MIISYQSSYTQQKAPPTWRGLLLCMTLFIFQVQAGGKGTIHALSLTSGTRIVGMQAGIIEVLLFMGDEVPDSVPPLSAAGE